MFFLILFLSVVIINSSFMILGIGMCPAVVYIDSLLDSGAVCPNVLLQLSVSSQGSDPRCQRHRGARRGSSDVAWQVLFGRSVVQSGKGAILVPRL